VLIRTLLAAAGLSTLTPRPADAQIHVYRDAGGQLVMSNSRVDAPTQVERVQGAPSYFSTTRLAGNPTVYEPLVQEYASRHALRPELVRAVIHVESGFNPRATSPVGAMGLMQLMPATARELGVRDPYDPAQNIGGGTKYLRQLLDKYEGNEELALAAYNAGSGAVDKYGQRVPPYRETQDYVKKVGSRAGRTSAVAHASAHPTFYKTYEIIDGRIVPKISQRKPASGTYEILRP
jgi:hypothetical protein